VQVTPKRLEILHEVVPAAAEIAVLVNPTSPTTDSQLRNLQAAARALGLQLHVLHASIERAFDLPACHRPARESLGKPEMF
jgi:putative ABC transport system substrate-binding protein